jgi:hypothetical protein
LRLVTRIKVIGHEAAATLPTNRDQKL